jgi:hypothetical protein
MYILRDEIVDRSFEIYNNLLSYFNTEVRIYTI